MEIEVTTTELEMLSPGEFKPKQLARNDVLIKKIEIPTPVINHFFFVNVGRPWKWYSRLKWTLADWKALVEKETSPTWIGYIQGSPLFVVLRALSDLRGEQKKIRKTYQ